MIEAHDVRVLPSTAAAYVAPRPWLALWCERVALFVLGAFFCLHVLPSAWRTLNTDFPNYYMCARLAHEHVDTARANEWIWLQRAKDHRALDDRLISLIPITPFSTLLLWPVTGFSAPAARHAWILFNLMLLPPLAWMLRRLTALRWEHIALTLLLSIPPERNLLYGQFYLLLLVLLTAALLAYLCRRPALAGTLVGFAAALKVFPILFAVFFVRRRNGRALAGLAIALAVCATVSLAVFGRGIHRTYLSEVLPWTLRGEGMPPYTLTAASISTLLHFLLLAEPGWNPHPWHNSPELYALLQPMLQMLVLAPAILLIRRESASAARITLEWCALLTASLAISTMPASYHFVLMVLPVCVLAAHLLARRRNVLLAVLAAAYAGLCLPLRIPAGVHSPAILLFMPRLPVMLLFVGAIYWILWRDDAEAAHRRQWSNPAWATLLALSVVFSVRSTLHVERAMRGEYQYRLPSTTSHYLEADPQITGSTLRFITMTQSGYSLVTRDAGSMTKLPASTAPIDGMDVLSFAQRGGRTLVERAGAGRSVIVDDAEPASVLVEDARSPMFSTDGRTLAYMRDEHGRGRLMVRAASSTSTFAFSAPAFRDRQMTPSALNVYEASFVSPASYAFSATQGSAAPQIYLTDATHTNVALGLGETRYPALSPDGRWLTYSRMERSAWNLWLRDQRTGAVRRIADVPCNQIQPTWEQDSKTLVYSTDCGRSLWFTSLARRQVIP